DLNLASRSELMQLPGVGETTADKIVTARERRGGFRQVDDLREVKGIGPAKMEAMRPWLQLGADRENSVASGSPAGMDKNSRSGGKKEALTAGIVIDVNRATVADLQRLPGIGPVLAQRIIAERDKRPFSTIEDLRRVSGIGPKTLEKLRPYITVGDRGDDI